MKDINLFFCTLLKQLPAKRTGRLKKLGFTKLSFRRSCFQKGRYTYDIFDTFGNAQFGKTQFFRHPVYPDIAVARIALFSISEANIVFGQHIPKE